MKQRRILIVAALLVTVVLPVVAQQRGIIAPDTGGVSYGLSGVNAVNTKYAGVIDRPAAVLIDGTQGVNAVNRVNAGVTKALPSIQADVPAMESGTDVPLVSQALPLIKPKPLTAAEQAKLDILRRNEERAAAQKALRH